MAKARVPRTQVAMKGMSLADRFNSFFESDAVSTYAPKLLEPAAESTGGGKQATQHMTLQPADSAQPVLTVGWVNCSNNNAKLRTYGCMQQLLAARFGKRKVVLDAAAYQAFFDKVKGYLEKNGMQVSVEEIPPELTSGAFLAAQAPARSSTLQWVLVGLLLIAVGAALWAFAGGR